MIFFDEIIKFKLLTLFLDEAWTARYRNQLGFVEGAIKPLAEFNKLGKVLIY